MAAVNICSDLGAQENKICHCFYFFPIYLPWRSVTPYVPLCLSLNSFCYETSRTWASFGPETRCVISVGRSWALAEFKSWPCGFKSQTGFFFIDYKLALSKNICQWLSNNKGICHLPLRTLSLVLLQLLTFDTTWRQFRVESEALCGPEKLEPYL